MVTYRIYKLCFPHNVHMCRVTTSMTANKSGPRICAGRTSAAVRPIILPDTLWFCHTHASSGFMLSDTISSCEVPVTEPSRLTLTGLKFGFRVPASATQQRPAAQRAYSLRFLHLLDGIVAYSCENPSEQYTPLLVFNAWAKKPHRIRTGEAPETRGEGEEEREKMKTRSSKRGDKEAKEAGGRRGGVKDGRSQ